MPPASPTCTGPSDLASLRISACPASVRPGMKRKETPVLARLIYEHADVAKALEPVLQRQRAKGEDQQDEGQDCPTDDAAATVLGEALKHSGLPPRRAAFCRRLLFPLAGMAFFHDRLHLRHHVRIPSEIAGIEICRCVAHGSTPAAVVDPFGRRCHTPNRLGFQERGFRWSTRT